MAIDRLWLDTVGGTACWGFQGVLFLPSEEQKNEVMDLMASCETVKSAVLSVLTGYCNTCSICFCFWFASYTIRSVWAMKSQIMVIRVLHNQRLLRWRPGINPILDSFRIQTGRITASKFKSVCHRDPANPSLSQIMSICHPEAFCCKAEATIWAYQLESSALEEYRSRMCHNGFSLTLSGMFIIVQHSFLEHHLMK